MIDVLVLAACAAAAALGWRNGALRTALPVIGLVAGYAAALLLYRPLGGPLTEHFGFPPLLAYAMGGGVALIGTSLAFGVLRRRLAARAADGRDARESPEEGPEGPARASRIGGAALGAAWALGIALVLVWGVESVSALSGGGGDRSITGRVGARAFGGVTRAVIVRQTGDRFSGAAAAAMMVDPAGFSRTVNRLATSDGVRKLATDPELTSMLADGRVAELAARPEVAELARDADFVDAARRLGVLDAGGAATPEQLAASLADALGPITAAARELREDPSGLEALERLDIGARLEAGDVLGLLNDPDFAAVTTRIRKSIRER